MSLLLTFMDLDKIYESTNNTAWLDRDALISNIKAAGKRYNFNAYSDSQLYRMWQRIQEDEQYKDIELEYAELTTATKRETCDNCGTELTDGGYCPVCDDGEEDYN